MRGKLYDWPTKPFDKTHKILSTVGEYRAAAPDITKLHSGTDLPEHGDAVEVFSPDVGVVTRDSHGTNPSQGSGAIRVGHFGFNHPQDVFPKVDSTHGSVKFPADLPIHVVERGGDVYAPVTTTPDLTKDADFKKGPMPDTPEVGYIKAGARYERVSLWPRTRAIAGNVQPTDLHVIYYESDQGEYRDTKVGNALEVLRNYENKQKPQVDMLWLYAHASDVARLSFDREGATATLDDTDKGAKLKVKAVSQFVNGCGIYQLEYEIACGDPPKTTKRLNVWMFHGLPAEADSFVLVDEKLSKWENVGKPKWTSYVLTASDGATLSADHHWELEDRTKWPDCRYTIKVWVKNIQASKGEGVDPESNEVGYVAELEVVSTSATQRKLTVRKKLTPL